MKHPSALAMFATTLLIAVTGPSAAAPASTPTPAQSLDAALDAGEAAMRRGDYGAALSLAGTVNAEAPRSDRRRQSAALTLRAQVLSDLGQLDEARLALEAALNQLTGTTHTDALVEILVTLGELRVKLGDVTLAASAFDEASAWNSALNGQHRAASIENAKARLAAAAGDYRAAKTRYLAAAEACGVGQTSDQVACRLRAQTGLAQVALAAGDPLTARRGFDDVLAGLDGSDLSRDRALTLLGSAQAHLSLGDVALAERRCSEALAIARRIKHRALLADAHVLSGQLAQRAGRLDVARGHLQTAFDHYQAMRSVVGMSRSRVVLATLLRASGDLTGAATHLSAARKRFAALGDRQGLIETAAALAEIARATGNTPKEVRLLRELVAVRPSYAIAATAHTRLGGLALAQGDRANALVAFQAAAASADRVPTRRLTDSARAAVLATRSAAFDRVLATLLAPSPTASADAVQRQATTAMHVSEQSVARDFVDVLERARLRRDEPRTASLLDELDAVDLAQRRLPLTDAGSDQVVAQLAERRGALERELLGLRATAIWPNAPQRLERAVTELAAGLRPDVAVLKYHLADHASVLFVVTTDGVEAITLAGRAEVAALVQAFLETLEQPSDRASARRVQARRGRSLYKQLLAPALAALGGRTRLVVIPHLELRLLPLDALIVPDRVATAPERAAAKRRRTPVYALDRFTISYAPSLAALYELHRDGVRRSTIPRHPLLAFADPVYTNAPITLPRLEASANEVRAARDHILADPGPGTLFLREDASEARLKALTLSRYAIIHLATHGFAPDRVTAEEQPALFLTRGGHEDGVLRLDEVLDLHLDADLVVLSACSSGRGDLRPGDGLGALTRAFLYAGSSSVMATLWAVEDRHASRMMDVFYADLGRGVATPDALRHSRLALLDGDVQTTAQRLRFRGIGGVVKPDTTPPRPMKRQRRARSADPFFWAAYVLIGESGDVLR